MLGCETSRDQGLVKFNCSIMQVHQDLSSSSATQSSDRRAAHPYQRAHLVKENPDRFEGLGAMKPYHITWAIHPPRQVPVHLGDHYKREIDNMLKLGVIMPVKKPTDWVNSIVLSETTNDKGEITKVRVCLDPCDRSRESTTIQKLLTRCI